MKDSEQRRLQIQSTARAIRALRGHAGDLEAVQTKLDGSVSLGTAFRLMGESDDFDFVTPIAFLHDPAASVVQWLRERVTAEMLRTYKQILRYTKALARLKMSGGAFQRNLRSFIRDMQRFLFKNMDDTHRADRFSLIQ